MQPHSVPHQPSARSDEELMAAVACRDEFAMLLLHDRYQPLIFAVANRVVAEQSVAEDVVQEVLLQLWLSPQSYNPRCGNLPSWLAVVSRHKAVDWVRRQRKNVALAEETVSYQAPQDRKAVERDAKRKALFVLSTLPEPQRKAFYLAFFKGHSHAEISALTGEKLGTVKSRIRSALQILRAHFMATASDSTTPGAVALFDGDPV